jgi:hypothetical protein
MSRKMEVAKTFVYQAENGAIMFNRLAEITEVLSHFGGVTSQRVAVTARLVEVIEHDSE